MSQIDRDTPGLVRFNKSLHGHPSDGMLAGVSLGDGAHSSVINPWADPHMEWVIRYGDVEAIRYSVASVIGSYAYLLSGDISTTEAIRRLRLLRKATASLRGRELGEPGAPGEAAAVLKEAIGG